MTFLLGSLLKITNSLSPEPTKPKTANLDTRPPNKKAKKLMILDRHPQPQTLNRVGRFPKSGPVLGTPRK